MLHCYRNYLKPQNSHICLLQHVPTSCAASKPSARQLLQYHPSLSATPTLVVQLQSPQACKDLRMGCRTSKACGVCSAAKMQRLGGGAASISFHRPLTPFHRPRILLIMICSTTFNFVYINLTQSCHVLKT